MSKAAKVRLTLYILIGALPELIGWLTLTFDWSPRGVAIITAKLLLAACINWRAFIDGNGKPPPPDGEATVTATISATTTTEPNP